MVSWIDICFKKRERDMDGWIREAEVSEQAALGDT